jgi:phage shock protein PspC (stress-responsive transcriptional regulator)
MTEHESTSGEPATPPAADARPDEPAVRPADARPDEPGSPGPAGDVRPDESGPAVDVRPDEPGSAGEPTAETTADQPTAETTADQPTAETTADQPTAETTADEPSRAEPSASEPPAAEPVPVEASAAAADEIPAAEPAPVEASAAAADEIPAAEPAPARAQVAAADGTTAVEPADVSSAAAGATPAAEPVPAGAPAAAADGSPAAETPDTPLAGEPVGSMAGEGPGHRGDAATERIPGAGQHGEVGDAATERIPGTGGATAGAPGGDVPPANPGPGGATAAGFPAGAVPPSGGPWSAFTGRRLARSSQRKVIAGVAGGLGEYTGIDPVLFRVLFAVLTLFGGSGILLYVAGWLFMPADDEQSSPVESLLHRGPGGSNRARDAAAAGALVIAGLVLAGVLALGDARDLALVLVVVGGAFFLVRNLQERRDGGPPQPAVPQPTPPPPAPYETPLPTYQPQPAYQPQPPYPPVQHTAPTVTLPPPPAPTPPRPREHSALGMITVSLLLVVLGVAAALTATGAIDPEPDDLLAVAVGTIGAGLLVGAWFGRARWLTWLGIPLLIALIVVSASNVSLKGGVGDRRYDPQSAAQVQPEYRIGIGSIRLDLSDVDFSEQLVRTKVSAGVGNIEVIVPRTTDVSIEGRAGVGEIDLLGQVANGTSASRSVVDHGPGGDGKVDLTLDLDVSIGRVEVDRAAA